MNKVYRGWIFSYMSTDENNEVIYKAVKHHDGRKPDEVIIGTYAGVVKHIDDWAERSIKEYE